MKYAATAIVDGVETIVILLPLSAVPMFDPDNPPQSNTYAVGDEVQNGWVKMNGVFVAPPASPVKVPKSCSRRQGRLALLQTPHGVDSNKLDAAEALLASIADPMQRRQAQIEYEADTWERSNVFLQNVWSTLGGTPAELDDLYLLAVTL